MNMGTGDLGLYRNALRVLPYRLVRCPPDSIGQVTDAHIPDSALQPTSAHRSPRPPGRRILSPLPRERWFGDIDSGQPSSDTLMPRGESLASGVAVVGTGYVGTVVAAVMASLGRSVVGLEIDESKLRSLRQGRAPFYEPGLNELLAAGLAEGRLRFTNDVGEAMASSEVVFLCVGTPGNSDGRPDLRALETVARALGRAMNRHHVLVTKSTVPVGAGRWLESVLGGCLPPAHDDPPFSLVSNPEFLREGTAIDDFLHPDRVVLGSDDAAALEAVADVYRPVLDQSFRGGNGQMKPPLLRTDLATAEAVKLVANAFLAAKVSLINEVANICELVGADIMGVAAAVGLDRRIGARFLQAGVGWGGSCLGKDLDVLMTTAEEHGYTPHLLKAVGSVNSRQRSRMVEKVEDHLGALANRHVALLGLAFKPGTDDLRDAPALDIASRLLAAGAVVSAYDPAVGELAPATNIRLASDPYAAADGADAVMLVTEWPEFLALDLTRLASGMGNRLFVDCRNALDPAVVEEAGFRYESVGRSRAKTPVEVRG